MFIVPCFAWKNNSSAREGDIRIRCGIHQTRHCFHHSAKFSRYRTGGPLPQSKCCIVSALSKKSVASRNDTSLHLVFRVPAAVPRSVLVAQPVFNRRCTGIAPVFVFELKHPFPPRFLAPVQHYPQETQQNGAGRQRTTKSARRFIFPRKPPQKQATPESRPQNHPCIPAPNQISALQRYSLPCPRAKTLSQHTLCRSA